MYWERGYFRATDQLLVVIVYIFIHVFMHVATVFTGYSVMCSRLVF